MSNNAINKDMKLICVVYGKKIDDKYGHNPKPVNDTGRCCTKCNKSVVIPARTKIEPERQVNEEEEWETTYNEDFKEKQNEDGRDIVNTLNIRLTEAVRVVVVWSIP